MCSQWKNPVNLKLINVEPDKDNTGIFDSLERATYEWKQRGIVQNIRSEFFPALDQILHSIGDQPALFFIDPFGPSQVHFSHLKPILGRNQKITELIINFDTDGLHRIATAALSPNTNPKVAETDALVVSQIVGSSKWQDEFRRVSLTTQDGKIILLHEYLDNIRKFGYEIVAYQIRESLRTHPHYHFVYCTRHSDGIALMNDFVREEEDLTYDDHVGSDLPLFADEASLSNAIEDRRHLLRVAMELYLEKNTLVTRGKIKSDFLAMNFGQFHNKDYNAVVQQLMQDQVFKERSGKTRINDNDILEYNIIAY